MAAFTHLDKGDKPVIVNVGKKPVTQRRAKAKAVVALPDAVFEALQQ